MNRTVKTFVYIIIGQFIATLGFASVLIPNNLVPVGLGGVASIINVLTGWDIQMLLIILSLPLIIWAYFNHDKDKLFYAAFCYGLFTFYFGIVSDYVPEFVTDPIVASVLGGILLGIGSGMVISRGIPNGPEALVGLYLKDKRDIPVPTFLMVMNMVIICSSIIYGELTMIVYSIVTVYISGKIANYVVIGSRRYFVVNIVSDQYLDITEFIRKELKRSVTFVQAMDTSNVRKRMLVKTVISSRELVRLREHIRSYADDSFVYAIESASIIGGGFE